MRSSTYALAKEYSQIANEMKKSVGACTPSDEPTPHEDQPLIILDTDLGSSTDDLFAMEMLYDYHRRGLCTFLGIIVDREGANCAACADVMNTWHGFGALPLGLVRDGLKDPKVWIDYRQMPYNKNRDSTDMFRRSIADYASLPDGWVLSVFCRAWLNRCNRRAIRIRRSTVWS